MWKHWVTVTTITISIILTALLAVEYLLLALVLGGVVLAVTLFFGVTQVRFNYFVNSVNHGLKGVSLTFDDGPDRDTTLRILDILDKHQVKGTFFLIGKNIPGNEDIVKDILNRGHLIGNHSYSHDKTLPTKGAKTLKEEFDRCGELLTQLAGRIPVFVRIPFGLSTPNYYRALKGTSYIPVGWDFRTFDTMYKEKEKLKEVFVAKAKDASIILLHDANEITLEILDEALAESKKNGIKFVPLDENIGRSAYD